jgi:hypothetical protein
MLGKRIHRLAWWISWRVIRDELQVETVHCEVREDRFDPRRHFIPEVRIAYRKMCLDITRPQNVSSASRTCEIDREDVPDGLEPILLSTNELTR